MSLVAKIHGKTASDCHVTSIRKGNLSIDLSNEQAPYLVIDFDELGSPLGNSQTRPDFLFVSDTGGNIKGNHQKGRLATIEVSSGKSKSAGHIQRQIQAGVDWAKNHFDANSAPSLIPVYLGRVDRFILMKLKKVEFRVTLYGQKKPIKILSKGKSLPKP